MIGTPGKAQLSQCGPGTHAPDRDHHYGGWTDLPHPDLADLREALRARDPAAILKVLERNAEPARMALRQGFGDTLAFSVYAVMDARGWARARALLGDSVPLHLQVASHDPEAIFADIERYPDKNVLALFLSMPTGAFVFAPTQPAGCVDDAAPQIAPADLVQLQSALRDKLDASDYYRAMRLLLMKAERALSREPVVTPRAAELNGVTVSSSDLVIDLTTADGGLIAIGVGQQRLPPVSQMRVDLAEERIRAADANGDWSADAGADDEAILAMADLSAVERKALALRLRDKPLKRNIGGGLQQLAEIADDAAVIQRAIAEANSSAILRKQAAKGVGLEVAIERAGTLVREARARLAALPANAPKDERERAQTQVDRLEAMFFGVGTESQWVRMALRSETAHDPNGDPSSQTENLKAIGADPVTIARELLAPVSRHDVPALIADLTTIAPDHRRAALEQSGINRTSGG